MKTGEKQAHPSYFKSIDGSVHMQPGITYREWLIAHAPTEPQPWFQPTMPPRPKAPPRSLAVYQSDPDPNAYKLAQDWLKDPCWDLADQAEDERGRYDFSPGTIELLHRFQLAWNTYAEADVEWCKEKDRQRYIQWPAAWADAIVAALDGESMTAGPLTVAAYREDLAECEAAERRAQDRSQVYLEALTMAVADQPRTNPNGRDEDTIEDYVERAAEKLGVTL